MICAVVCVSQADDDSFSSVSYSDRTDSLTSLARGYVLSMTGVASPDSMSSFRTTRSSFSGKVSRAGTSLGDPLRVEGSAPSPARSVRQLRRTALWVRPTSAETSHRLWPRRAVREDDRRRSLRWVAGVSLARLGASDHGPAAGRPPAGRPSWYGRPAAGRAVLSRDGRQAGVRRRVRERPQATANARE